MPGGDQRSPTVGSSSSPSDSSDRNPECWDGRPKSGERCALLLFSKSSSDASSDGWSSKTLSSSSSIADGVYRCRRFRARGVSGVAATARSSEVFLRSRTLATEVEVGGWRLYGQSRAVSVSASKEGLMRWSLIPRRVAKVQVKRMAGRQLTPRAQQRCDRSGCDAISRGDSWWG